MSERIVRSENEYLKREILRYEGAIRELTALYGELLREQSQR